MKPLFPGYFFARFDPVVHIRNVHYARGVAYVVRRKEVPVHVPSQVMIELRLISPDGILEIPDQPHKIGDKIKVISGLFKGDEGTVTKLVPARERVKVLFEILGRQTEVEINEDEVDFPQCPSDRHRLYGICPTFQHTLIKLALHFRQMPSAVAYHFKIMCPVNITQM